ncbi:MAG: hypothetical protein DHS20C16_29710 [Phycisphaerae bacterium]|nr:MAG: hypothetical protein DHS20C16_29710 [Phycisphaerae bacterium]
MFRGLLHARLKAADRAIASGRLDDALRITTEPDIAADAKGAKLRARLAGAFIERAREHYRADRFTEAFLALGKADRCDGSQEKIDELRKQVAAVADEVSRQRTERRHQVELAKHRIHAGSLAAGRRILENAPDGEEEFDHLKRELESREKRGAELLAQAKKRFADKQIGSAIDRLARSLKINAHDEQAIQLERDIVATVIKNARSAFVDGRLAQMQQDLGLLDPLASAQAAKRELGECLTLAQHASKAIQIGDFDEARRLTQRMASLVPQAKWIKRATDLLVKVDENLLQLGSGPLGDFNLKSLTNTVTAAYAKMPARPLATAHTAGANAAGVGSTSLDALHLLVDGGGSYLILRNSHATIGRAASADPAQIPIFSDLGERHAEIARVEDDYFLMSPHEVEVGGRRGRQQLLRDGDRVVLARRAKFTFRLPNRRSGSALLDISDTSKMPKDVRNVILMKDTVMLGAGPSNHVVCPAQGANLILFERGGRLWVRGMGRKDPANTVDLGTPQEISGTSFTVQPWTMRTI